jgi:hypothetical protein
VNIIGPENIFKATHGPGEYAVVDRIKALPSVGPDIILSPESKYDKGGHLTGLMFRTDGPDAAVYPGLVPDNGCGFRLGLIKGLPEGFGDWDRLARAVVSYSGVYSQIRRRAAPADILSLITRSLRDATNFFDALKADESLPHLLLQPFGCPLGHFLEIRQPEEGFEPGEYILIIHSGSQGLHRLLNNKLHDKYRYHSRVYGAGLRTEEGRERALAAQMAAAYAEASRRFAFELIDRALRDTFGARAVFLSDIFHSYIQFGRGQVLHSRGIQNFDYTLNETDAKYYLLAGTHSTSSYLMTPLKPKGCLCHGTPEHFYADHGCGRLTPPDTLRWRDTEAEGDGASFEAVTKALADFFAESGAARKVTRLLPVLNMQRMDKG